MYSLEPILVCRELSFHPLLNESYKSPFRFMSSEGQIFLSFLVLIVSVCRVIGCSIDQDKEEEEGDGVVSIGSTTCLCEQEEQVSQTNPLFFSSLEIDPF